MIVSSLRQHVFHEGLFDPRVSADDRSQQANRPNAVSPVCDAIRGRANDEVALSQRYQLAREHLSYHLLAHPLPVPGVLPV